MSPLTLLKGAISLLFITTQTACLLKTDLDSEGRDIFGDIVLAEDMGAGDDGLPVDMDKVPEDMDTPPVDMTPNTGPCGDGEQDNDGDGICKPDCSSAPLNCTNQGFCSDATGEATCTMLPASCEQARMLPSMNGDGFYELFVGNAQSKNWDAICIGMDTATPKTYLPLGVTSGFANRFQQVDRDGLAAETSFWMVRINPVSLRVDVNDHSFSHTVHYRQDSQIKLPFGVIASCSRQNPSAIDWVEARGRIDLSNTPFRVADTFETYGQCGTGSARADGQVDAAIALSVDGGSTTSTACGRLGPSILATRSGSACNNEDVVPGDMTLPSEEVLQLEFVGGSRATQAPTTCLEHKLLNPAEMENVNVTLYADRDPAKPWTAFCRDLHTHEVGTYPIGIGARKIGPREYLSLENFGPEAFPSNTMSEGGDATDPVRKITSFRRIRFDPRTFEVDVVGSHPNDAETEKLAPDSDEIDLPYGITGNCDPNYPGTGQIDLRGTGFVVDDSFAAKGCFAQGDATFSSNGELVDLVSNGSECSSIGPIRDSMQYGDVCVEGKEGVYFSETDFLLKLSYP